MASDDPVDETFKDVFLLGHLLGAGLLRRNTSDKRFWSPCIRKLVILALLAVYLFGTLLLSFLAVPIPDKGIWTFNLDVYSAYPIIWGAFLLDGFACFVTINFSTKYLLDESDFLDQCRDTALVAQPSEKVLKQWRRRTIFVIGIFGSVLVAQIIVTVLAATSTVAAPVHMERAVYWLSIPTWFAWTAAGVIAAMSTVHVGYHCIFFSNQCEIVRVHIRTFCDSLFEEAALSLAKRRVDLYHAEYCRLIAMVQNLDCAFRISILCQLSLVTVGSCFILYLLTLGDHEWQPMIFIVFTLLTIFFTFSFTVVPAIMLDNQVYRPKALARGWFFKHERHCNMYKRSINEDDRQALALFMQSINAEDAGITVGSLAKLNIQLLVTLGSVIATYFMVILQFDQANCGRINFNLTEMCRGGGYNFL